jgi:hypothetical protein
MSARKSKPSSFLKRSASISRHSGIACRASHRPRVAIARRGHCHLNRGYSPHRGSIRRRLPAARISPNRVTSRIAGRRSFAVSIEAGPDRRAESRSREEHPRGTSVQYSAHPSVLNLVEQLTSPHKRRRKHLQKPIARSTTLQGSCWRRKAAVHTQTGSRGR